MIENLDIFFHGLDAKQILFTLSGGTQTVTGYFDNAFFDATIGETVLDTTAPRFTCKMSDVEGIPIESPCVLDGVAYTVMQIQPEGTGLAVVKLSHV